VHVRRRCVVREVHWQRDGVVVTALQHGRALEVAARQCIVTLPLGILQLPPQAPNGVRFVPALTAKQDALAGLATGPVIKVALQFREAFWERLDGGAYADAAFFHAPGTAFPTFWTTLPTRTALLTAWSAGPAAAALAGVEETQVVQTALEGVRLLFRDHDACTSAYVNARLHDWQADPFAGGAYSFVVAGGGDARKRLAEPLEDTLYFAGEAAAEDGESGTVAGALQSASSAVARVLAAS
jgi:monoamine oxidase